MAVSSYSSIRPSDISPDDVEIFYTFSKTREGSTETNLIKLDSNLILTKIDHPDEPGRIFGGLYNLRLPAETFSAKGIYTLVFKPTEIKTRIIDVGVLSSRPDIKGIILDTNGVDPRFISKFENGGLVGYRIEYLTLNPVSSERKLQNFFRLVTSSNKAEPVSENLNNTTQKALTYRFNNNSSLVFCTLTPSSSASIRPNLQPFIGLANQEIIITNTFFDPFMLEIEMVEHNEDTLAIGLFGNQTRSIEDGVLTYYNSNNDIYKQFSLYEIEDEINGSPLFEIKEELKTIDFSKNFGNIIN